MSPLETPLREYAERLSARRKTHSELSEADARLSYLRLAIFAAGIAAVVAGGRGWGSWWWLLVPLGMFIWVVRRHDRVIRARDQASRAIGFYERGVARLEDRWSDAGETGDRFADPNHPYAADLDLFGRGSLFQLLSIATTRGGEARLAEWLKAPAPAAVIRARQNAVADLEIRLDLREEVALAGTDVRAAVEPDALIAWAEASSYLKLTMLRIAAWIISIAAIGALTFWGLTGGVGPLVIVVILEIALFTRVRRQLHQILHVASGWSRDLDVLAAVVDRIERETFAAPALAELRQRLDVEGISPAAAIRRLHWLVEMHDWQHNLIFAVVAIPLLWDVHIAFAIDAWRRRYGSHVRSWLEVVAEFEALSSLATYRFEHPADPFPTIEENDNDASLAGEGLGHPLLPASRMVRNDLSLGGDTQLLVISGSNMSGKSTLLRTVGINCVLAFAGGAVRAISLRLTPLTIGATLRIQDSLQEGRSRFYAEITRVRELAEKAGRTPPLLFLLDELFHGTNSHDRLIGATGVLESFIDRGAIGLITTHDLALTAVAEQLAPRARNVHFDDQFVAGELVFDYRMKPGPVTRSNALALMRAVGLTVAEE
jgi:hypothetical protein